MSLRPWLNVVLSALLLVGPIAPMQARADSDESISFSEMAPSSASVPREQRESSLKARELPVTSSGAFTMGVSFDVPPGRAGMTPQIGLSYSSGAFRSDSPFGAGWSLGVARITRSTGNGVPSVVRTLTDELRYDDTPDRVFEAPAGRLVRLDCALTPSQCPEDDAGDVFIAEVEHEPARYVHIASAAGDEWIEHMPDGTKRFYGATRGASRARIVNAKGTFAWLLVREMDVHGNFIDYEWETDEQREDLATPQQDPVLVRVRWGAHRSGLPHLFSVNIDYAGHAGPVDFLRGGVRQDHRAVRVRVGHGSDSSPEMWRYELNVSASSFTQRLLLRSVRRNAPGETALNKGRFAFGYSGTEPTWEAEGVALPNGVYEKRCGLAAPGSCDLPPADSIVEATSPLGLRSAYQFIDLDLDGYIDITYLPAHFAAPEARIIAADSYRGIGVGAFARLSSPSFFDAFGIPAAGQAFCPLSGDCLYDHLADVDGDHDVDAVAFNMTVFRAPSSRDPFVLIPPDLCGDDLIWNQCGDIDPLPPFLPSNRLGSGVLEESNKDTVRAVVFCREFVTQCVTMAADGDVIAPGAGTEIVGSVGAIGEGPPAGANNAGTLTVTRGTTRDAGPQQFAVAELAGWPIEATREVRFDVQPNRRRPRETLRAIVTRDFLAPVVDINADGLSDVVLLKVMTGTEIALPTAKFLPRVYLAHDDGFMFNLAATVSLRERFWESLGNEVAARHYPVTINPTAMLVDVNSDSLPDVIAAHRLAGSGREMECRNGHDVTLNRGGTWSSTPLGFNEQWSSPAAGLEFTGAALDRLKNRAFPCPEGTRFTDPFFEDRLPQSAMSLTDINADGRVDVVFAWSAPGDADPRAVRHLEVYENGPRGFGEAQSPEALVALDFDLAAFGGQPHDNRAFSLVDLARFVDMDSDGLVDVVKSGIIQGDNARWHRNLSGRPPDLLERIETEGGASTDVVYEPGTRFGLPGQYLATNLERRSGVGNAFEDVVITYTDFVRDAATREPIGFASVQSVHTPKAPDGAPLTVTRTYDTTEVVNGVRYPLRGQVRELVADDGDMQLREELTHGLVAFEGAVAVRARTDVTTSQECNASACEERVTQVFLRDDFGYPIETFDGDATDETDAVTIVEERTERRGAWVLGLVEASATLGRDELVGGVVVERPLTPMAYSYDERGALERVIRLGRVADVCGTGVLFDETAYVVNTLGLLTRTTRSDRVVIVDHDDNELYPRRTQITATGAATLNELTQYDVRVVDWVSRIDANGHRWLRAFDSRGRVTSTFAPGPVLIATARYVDVGAPLVEEEMFRGGGRSLSRRTTLDGWGSSLGVVEGSEDDGFIRRSRVDRDGFGRVVFRYQPAEVTSIADVVLLEDGASNRFTTEYDAFDRVVLQETPDGRIVQTRYGPRFTDVVNARGFSSLFERDAFDRLVRVTHFESDETQVASQHTLHRNGRGDIVRIVDGDGLHRSLEHDEAGRLLRTTLPGQVGLVERCFDDNDALVHVETQAGRTVDITRDGLARPHEMTVSGEDGTKVFTHQYDRAASNALGRRFASTDPTGRELVRYDSFGRVAERTHEGHDASVDYEYDLQGAVERFTVSAGPVVATTALDRDDFGRVRSIDDDGALVHAIGYDAYDRPIDALFEHLAARWQFDPQKEVLESYALFLRDGSASVSGETATALVPDEEVDASPRGPPDPFPGQGRGPPDAPPVHEGRGPPEGVDVPFAPGFFATRPATEPEVVDIQLAAANETELLALSYIYDDNLNPIGERRIVSFLGQRFHEYDALDRLVGTRQFLGDEERFESFVYSPGGSIIGAADLEYASRRPGVSPQAVTHIERSGELVRELDYDADGFATTDESVGDGDAGGSVTRLTFDGAGCLVSSVRGARRVDRICNAAGDEVMRTTEVSLRETTITRVAQLFGIAELRPDEDELVVRIDAGAGTIVESVYALSTGELMPATRAMHKDLRGSVVATSSLAEAALNGDIEYDAWGASIAANDAPRHRFLDAEQDALGLYVLGKRAYSPTLRRWFSPDPLITGAPVVDSADGRQLNLYAYAANNPVKYTDPTGEIIWFIAVPVVLGAVAVSFASDSPQIAADGSRSGDANLLRPLLAASMMIGNPVIAGGGALTAGKLTADDVLESAAPQPSLPGSPAAGALPAPSERGPNIGSRLPGGGPHTATDDGVILPAGTDVDAVPVATPNPRDPKWGQVHNSHPHQGDPRAHAHGPEAGTGRRKDAPLAETMKRVDKGIKTGELRKRTDRSDKGGN